MKKGFTLIELLIVIGILAILATTVVLVLNPAQLTAQARDTQRISDLSTVKSAIGIYLSTASEPALTAGPYSTADTTCGFTTCTVTTSTVVTGSGWVAVDLTGTSGGSPIAALPVDPVNSATYQYAYRGDETDKTFELNARLESAKYRALMTTDGGDKNTCGESYNDATCYYEIGTEPGLDL
jgi:prepilin-type N-terminal cleavage/methylation domain-containing protein